jgi:hypothetical protein
MILFSELKNINLKSHVIITLLTVAMHLVNFPLEEENPEAQEQVGYFIQARII